MTLLVAADRLRQIARPNSIIRPAAIQTPKLELRHYQHAAVEALWDGLMNGGGNILGVLPTGTGKALVLCELARRLVQEHADVRILVLTHSKELVDQNFKEMVGLWPKAPAGIHSAGLKRRDVDEQIIFGSIQSIHRKAVDLQRVDIVIVDEAQSIPRDADTTWLKFFDQVGRINPYFRVVGLTAPAYRMDSGKLHEGKGALFDRIVYEYSIIDAIRDGFLSTPISRPSLATQIDTTGVGIRGGGDFVAGELDAAASDPVTVEAIADEFVAAGQDRRGWILFGCGVKHCMMLRDAIRRRGYSCEGVFAQQPKEYPGSVYNRDAFVEAFKRQEIRCLVSVNALAVGFNAKHIDLVGLARPTRSTGFYIQACGRGTRLFPGKENVLILDWGGNVSRHGFLDKPNVKPPSAGGPGDTPVKTCQACGSDNRIAARECSTCGAPFEIEGSKLSWRAANAPLLSTQMAPPEWVEVSNVIYSLHAKPPKTAKLKAVYKCGLMIHNKWVCFDDPVGSFARRMADTWWSKCGGQSPAPESVQEALERTGELNRATAIQIRPAGPDGKYMEVHNYKFD